MKKIIFIIACLFTSNNINAQITDDFESNNFGWTESVSSFSEAIIKEGHLHLKGGEKGILSSCYAPFDISKPCEIKCEVFIKSLTGSKHFGIILDYEDDYNFIRFDIQDDKVVILRYSDNVLVGRRISDLKMKSKKKTGLDLKIEYTLNKLTLFVNDVKAIDYSRRMSKDQFMLGTTGLGFYAGRSTEIDIDNLVITQ